MAMQATSRPVGNEPLIVRLDMAVANKSRDIVNPENPEALFRNNQSLGRFFDTTMKSIFSRNQSIELSDKDSRRIRIRKRSDWKDFKNTYLVSSSSSQTDRAIAENLQNTLGISLPNFVRFIDDVRTASKGLKLNVQRGTELANRLKLYDSDLYASLNENELFPRTVEVSSPSSPIGDNDSGESFEISDSIGIYGAVIKEAPNVFTGRHKDEVEWHIDFDASSREYRDIFREHSGNQVWRPLTVEAIDEDLVNDSEKIDLLIQYNLPLFLEQNDEGEFQDARQAFVDVYIDSKDDVLSQHNMSLRARVRPDKSRSLIQMKHEEDVDSQYPKRDKWERRWRGGRLSDEFQPLERLIEYATYGYCNGTPMPEVKRLYQKLLDNGAMEEDGFLDLAPDHIIFQRRRRTHLQMNTSEELVERLEQLKKLRQQYSNNNVPSRLVEYLAKTKKQMELVTKASKILEKYEQAPAGGETILISQDRYSVFEPGAYAYGNWPERLGDRGRRGRGIRVEAELDSTASIPLDAAIDTILGYESRTAQHRADLRFLRSYKAKLHEDVRLTAELQAQKLEGISLVRLANQPTSKSQAAKEMIQQGQAGFRKGHRFWV